MVSGAVALLLQDEPNLNPDQVKYRLMATANKSWAGYSATKAGAGVLDVYAAVRGTTTQKANTGLAVSNSADHRPEERAGAERELELGVLEQRQLGLGVLGFGVLG